MTDLHEFTPQERQWVEAFLSETTLFLGPDPEIMNDHRMAPRTAEEDRLLSGSGSWRAWTRRSR
jgi:acetone carboxylase, alpha subunit